MHWSYVLITEPLYSYLASTHEANKALDLVRVRAVPEYSLRVRVRGADD